MKSMRVQSEVETYALIFDKGDEVVELLTAFAKARRITGAEFQAIGAFSDAVLGYFDRATKQYRKIPVPSQVEVVSLLGDIAMKGDEPAVHAHAVLGQPDGTARVGHLLQARVWPTLELILTKSSRNLQKRVDPESGLALIDFPTERPAERPAA